MVGTKFQGAGAHGFASRAAAGARGQRRAGFTMAELALAMTVMLVALLSMSAANLRTNTLRRQNHERSLALSAIRSMADRIRAESERALGLEDPTNPGQTWAALVTAALAPGGAIGTTFDVTELTPAGAAGRVGSVAVITDETVTDAGLGLEIGMPRDLDLDGSAADTDVTSSARVLPVILQVNWIGVSGTTQISHPLILMGY